jgi:acyl-CoA synthetase (NDP forming)
VTGGARQLLHHLAAEALARGDGVLTEPELYRVLDAAGLPVPGFAFVPRGSSSAELRSLSRGPAVLKVVSRDVLHKSDVGGVRFLDRGNGLTADILEGFFLEVERRFEATHGRRPHIEGALVLERVEFDRGRIGAELIVGLRRTSDFGLVGMVGLGGLKAELLGERLPRREGAALFVPGDAEGALRELRETLGYRDLAGQLRGSSRLVEDAAWLRVLRFLDDVARALPVDGPPGAPALEELEFNPMVVDAQGRLLALDGLARVTRAAAARPRPPVEKLRALFTPGSVAVAGVSSKGVNLGRIILRNLLRDGFAPEALTVLKPGDEAIDGVRCVPDAAALPSRVDLAVLAVSAAAAPEVLSQLVAGEKAEAVVVIPGGMAEKAGGEARQRQLEALLDESRGTPWGGPVVCGPNSMGVTSLPGHLDTTFIPAHRLEPRHGARENLAFISQSGAFTLSRGSQLGQVRPRYLVSAGNQMDVSLAEYVGWVAKDAAVDVIAVYVEGFQPGDGARFLAAARAARDAGKRVVLYRAGRSPEGQGTAAGHTAAIAGDARVCWHLARAAGVLVAETFAEFDGLVRVACALAGRERLGRRVMLMSNAGFEVVGMADHLRGEEHSLELGTLSDDTRARMARVLEEGRLAGLVDVKNPLDATPSATDAVHLALAEAALADEGVDALVLGLVPMSPAVSTLGQADDASETVTSPHSLARTLPRLFAQTRKPLVTVVDAGPLYEPLVRALEAGGVPVFRRADEAVRALGRWLCG